MRKIGISNFSIKPTNFYKIDVMISVGHRVKSVQGTHFRQWTTVPKIRTVQDKDDRKVSRELDYYNLDMSISLGYRLNSPIATNFSQWSGEIMKEFTIRGLVIDDERLTNDGSILTKQQFKELLEHIREISLWERKFYQKITDIYSTVIDYDSLSEATHKFFATL